MPLGLWEAEKAQALTELEKDGTPYWNDTRYNEFMKEVMVSALHTNQSFPQKVWECITIIPELIISLFKDRPKKEIRWITGKIKRN